MQEMKLLKTSVGNFFYYDFLWTTPPWDEEKGEADLVGGGGGGGEGREGRGLKEECNVSESGNDEN